MKNKLYKKITKNKAKRRLKRQVLEQMGLPSNTPTKVIFVTQNPDSRGSAEE